LKIFQKNIARLLLVVLSVYFSPKELLHEFTHHEDSTDVTCHHSCKHHLEREHQHCDILQLSTPPLYHHVHNFSFLVSFAVIHQPAVPAVGYKNSFSASVFLRGPPALS